MLIQNAYIQCTTYTFFKYFISDKPTKMRIPKKLRERNCTALCLIIHKKGKNFKVKIKDPFSKCEPELCTKNNVR